MTRARYLDWAVSEAREVLRLDAAGRPDCTKARVIVAAVNAVLRTGDETAIDLCLSGFLADRHERYEEHVAPLMVRVDGGAVWTGADPVDARHFVGQVPRHQVELSPYSITAVPVTNELYRLLDVSRPWARTRDAANPLTDVSWFEAVLFALWVGCSLPTEAQWEHACAAGSTGEWCCDSEDLPAYAWYSETSAGHLHPVATRRANRFGLFDMHGNVWEWCRDSYDQDYYSRSEPNDPVCDPCYGGAEVHHACRGGSALSLAEMCGTRYRLHEPATFWASDLGFRLVRPYCDGPSLREVKSLW